MILSSAIPLYLDSKRKLSQKSRKTYEFALGLFAHHVREKPVEELTHKDLRSFVSRLEKAGKSESTINLAISATTGFFRWASFDRLWSGNVSDIEYTAKESRTPPRQEAPVYDREPLIALVSWAFDYAKYSEIIDKRDSFLVLSASSTGARLGRELCQLKRGQVDLDTGRAFVIGKGNKPGKILFSDPAIEAGRLYLRARGEMDGRSGLPVASLPLFSRHSGNTTKPLGYHGAYKSLKRRVREMLGDDKADSFHPHLLRHEFVSRILEETGNLKLAQDLARHKNIQITQRYAHLLEGDEDLAHKEIFNKRPK